MTYQVGQLVTWSMEKSYGPAKIRAIQQSKIEIEYFVSVAQRRKFAVDARELSPYTPWPQNRCYVQDLNEHWKMGRILELREDPREPYLVQFPNGEEKEVQEKDLYLRWDQGDVHPIEVLKHHGHETPFFFQRRWPLVEHFHQQVRASHGIPALLSSAIDLREHQVDVIRRISQDPVQRYLLADEVGLGKTIEAGVLIRQFLLDHPQGSLTVLVPDHLVGQWKRELKTKFFLGDFPDAQGQILPHSTTKYPASDLVVIDEAHHLTQWWMGSPEEQVRFRKLAEWAHRAPRLFLLSATPASTDQQAFLGMLHLLEPKIYPLSAREAFERKVQERERVGYLFFGLQSDLPGEMLRPSLEELRDLFADDPQVQRYTDELELHLADEDEQQKSDLVEKLRIHISETHRLHRRMLRNRRSVHAESLVRGRQKGTPILVHNARLATAWETLETWREELSVAVHQGRKDRSEARRLLKGMVEAALAYPGRWRHAVRVRLGLQNDLELSKTAFSSPFFPGEKDVLRDLLQELEDQDESWLQNLLPHVHALTEKTVVFSSDQGEADLVFAALKRGSMQGRVMRCEDGASALEFAQNPVCTTLVADCRSEEGVNLQCADVLIHLDLPLNPNRMEQRIGRLDRYGRGKAIVSKVVVDRVWPLTVQRYLEILQEGLGVFDRSISALQFLLNRLQDDLLDAFLEGESALKKLALSLPERLEEELGHLDQMDILESVQPQGHLNLQDFMDELFDVEAVAFEKTFLHWTHETLKLDTRFHEREVSFDFSRKSLIPWERIHQDFKHSLKRPSTFSRKVAQQQGFHLLRVGEPMVDTMARYLEWDDRGRAYAFWRHAPGWQDETALAFGLHFLLRADLGPAQGLIRKHHLEAAALQRRMDAFWGPRTRTLFVDHLGKAVQSEMQTWLTPLYKSGGEQLCDYNLSSKRLFALHELMPKSAWEPTCDRVLSVAEHELRTDAAFLQEVQEAARQARSMMLGQNTQLQARLQYGYNDVTPQSLKLEEELMEALLEGIQHPRVKLDAVGAVVLSSLNPFRNEA